MPEPAPEIVMDANGHYWRRYDDTLSMVPTTTANEPTEVVTVYRRESAMSGTGGLNADWSRPDMADATIDDLPTSSDALQTALRERDEARAALDDASRRIDSLRVEREVFFCQRCEAVGEELTCSCDDREHWVTLTVTSVGNLDRAIRERDEARALAEKQSDLLTRLAAERDRARAEVERLREVLRQIANGRLDGAQVSTTEEWADAAMSLARSGLTDEQVVRARGENTT